jgi:PAS domain S-box-containing protein
VGRKPTYEELEQELEKVKSQSPELEQVKQALKESVKRFEDLLEGLLDVYYRADLHGNIVLASPSILRSLRYDTMDEIIGKNLARDIYYDPADRTVFLAKLAEHGKLTSYEVKLKRKDGSAVWGETSTQFFYDESGEPAGVEGIFRDLTERRQAQIEKKKNEERVRALLNSSTDSAFLIDTEGVVLSANETMARRFGKGVEEILNANVFDLLPRELAEARKAIKEELVRSGKPVRWEDQRDGRFFYSVAHPIFDNRGRVVQIAVFGRNITAEKEAQKALKRSEMELRASEEKLKALLNASTNVVFLMDNDGTLLFLNEAMARTHQRPADELVGVNVWDLLPDSIARKRKAQGNKVIRIGKAVRFEDEHDGMFFDNVVYPVFDEQQNVVQLAIFSRNITPEKNAQEALKKSEAELKANAHELKEVNSALRALLRQRDKDTKDVEERVLANVKELALPYIKKMRKTRLDGQQKSYLKILDTNLREIVAPFVQGLSSKYSSLTPTEVQIAYLIRDGKNTREIAELFGSSKRTVESHRESIRIKLELKNKKVNLRSYLSSM